MKQNYGELNKILVPVPLKGGYKAALKQACYLRSIYGSQVTVLNVIPEISFPGRWFAQRRQEEAPGRVIKKLKRKVQKCFKENGGPDNVEILVVKGEIVPSILRIAIEKSFDLIIIKKARRIRDRKWFFKQENANRLIANSKCPVLTITGKPVLERLDRILLPVDIAKKTEIKEDWAKSMAKRFGAEIHVVSVMNRQIHHMQSFSYRKGRRIVEAMKKAGIKAELVLLEKGDRRMDKVVLSYAREFNPDLLVIMTHQENKLFDNYLGSFAREIIHQAEMPVFSVVSGR